LLYAKIRLIAAIERTIKIRTERNAWPAGTIFYVKQKQPSYGMVVYYPWTDEGIGISPEAAEILEKYESYQEMHDAAKEAMPNDY